MDKCLWVELPNATPFSSAFPADYTIGCNGERCAERIMQLETALSEAANELWRLPQSSSALLRQIRAILIIDEALRSDTATELK